MATRYLIPPCKRNLPKPCKKPDLICPLAIQLILLDRKVLKPPNSLRPLLILNQPYMEAMQIA